MSQQHTLAAKKVPTPCWAVLGAHSSVCRLGFVVQETWIYHRKLSEGPWRLLRAWHMSPTWKGWGSWEPGEEKARGNLINVYRYLMGGGVKNTPSSGTQQEERGNGHRREHRKFGLNSRKVAGYFKSCSGKLWSLHSWRHSKPNWIHNRTICSS